MATITNKAARQITAHKSGSTISVTSWGEWNGSSPKLVGWGSDTTKYGVMLRGYLSEPCTSLTFRVCTYQSGTSGDDYFYFKASTNEQDTTLATASFNPSTVSYDARQRYQRTNEWHDITINGRYPAGYIYIYCWAEWTNRIYIDATNPSPYPDLYSAIRTAVSATSYTLTTDVGSNSSITVERTASSFAPLGTLSHNSSIYNGDQLKITFTPAQNYAITTSTVNGSNFISGNTYTVGTSNVSVVSRATPLSFNVSATNGTIGDANAKSRITVSQGSTSYTYSLQYEFVSGGSNPITGYINASGSPQSTEVKISGSTTTINFSIPITFYAKIPNATSGTCKIICKTYNGSTQIGNVTQATFTASTSQSLAKPTVTGTVVDTDTGTITLTGNSSKLIRYRSNVRATINASSGSSASISSRTINGTSVPSSGYIDYTDTGLTSFAFSATDSRNYSNSYTVTPTVVQYIPLTINAELYRPTPTGTDLRLRFSGNYFSGSFGAYTNTLSIKFKFREKGGVWPSGWTTVSTSSYTIGVGTYSSVSSGVLISDSINYQTAYEVQLLVEDGNAGVLLTSLNPTITISKATPVFDWGANDFAIHGDLTVDGGGNITKAASALSTNIDAEYNATTFHTSGLNSGGTSGTFPSGATHYGVGLTLPYRKPYGNQKPDFAGQIYIPNGDATPNSMYFRTSEANAWDMWQKVHVEDSEDITFNVSYSAGTIGTRGYQSSASLRKMPHAVSISYIYDSSLIYPLAFWQLNGSVYTLYLNAYRATAGAVYNNRVIVHVLY